MKSQLVSKVLVGFVTLIATVSFAAPKKTVPQNFPSFPGTLVNARYVYVTSYDGNQFDPDLLPEDRQAIAVVQQAMEKWGKFIVVYEPPQADMVLMVMSRPSEDVLAVYDAHGWPGNQYLWRMMGRSGLQQGETPLVANLENAFERATPEHK